MNSPDELIMEMNYAAEPKLAASDWQGIPWGTKEVRFTKEQFRKLRSEHYQSHRNCDTELSFLKPPSRTHSNFFDFTFNHATIKCKNNHFQARDNVQVTDRNRVFVLTGRRTLAEYNTISRESRPLLLPDQMRLECFHVLGEYIAVGGSNGELNIHTQDGGRILSVNTQAEHLTSMTNASLLFSEGESLRVLSSSNDGNIRIYDTNRGRIEEFDFKACVNYSCLSQDQNLICSALDDTSVPVYDRRTGSIVLSFEGHLDYSFGVSWNPGVAHEIASCNQDHSVRIWDMRSVHAVHTLCGKIGAVLKLEYSSSGNYLAFSESVDYTQIYDTRDYSCCQVLELFGDCTGLAFSKESSPKNLYIGIDEGTFNSLLEFKVPRILW